MAKQRRPLALALILLLSLLGSTIPTQATATPDVVEWSTVGIPTDGKPGNWVLADGSDVQHLTMAIDGTIYAYANPSGTSYTLFKTDDGFSWSHTSKVTDDIVDIATSPDDADVIYYATSSCVYRSTDAGSSFTPLASNPGGAGSDNIEITAIDVVPLDNDYIIAVGTKDTDSLEYGGVYILEEDKPFATWIDTDLGSYDVYAVAFSPNFASDQQIVAVVTDEVDTLVTTNIDGDGWGQTVGDAIISGVTLNSAAIAFPSDYDSDVTTGDYAQFVAIDAGGDSGDVYMIEGVEAPDLSEATDLDIGADYGVDSVDVTSLAVTGNITSAYLLAGATSSAQVYYSTNGGTSWATSSKPPTGDSKTYVLMAADFAHHGKAYAATSGNESAFSYTTDGGVTWNQVGLIDTDISNIIDLAVSPNYSQDNTLFMLTWGGEHSLWRSLNGGEGWERLYSSVLADVDSIDLVKLSPQYNNDSQVVFIAGSSHGSPAIWKSNDNGQSFSSPRLTRDPITGTPFTIDTWAVASDKTLFIGSYDGGNGLVYRTTRSGLSYSTAAVAGSQSLNSIALSPDYNQDETILIGNTNGWVYWSSDNGSSFEPLPQEATSPPFTGSITVAFDPEYSENNTIYAASDTADKGIYRFIIGDSTSWEKIDSTLPAGGMIGQLIISADGTLYATNFKADGGIERSLNPTYSLGPTFETVTRGLDAGATLTGLWLHHNQLWSIDTTNTSLMTYTDSLTLPVTLTSPQDKAQGIGTMINHTISQVSLDWETAEGATKYRWQLDHDTDFSSVPAGFEDSTKASQAKLPALEPATTYYWRVRATEPVLSPWSSKWSFTTSLGSETIAPKLYSPEAGASNVELKPVFQWSTIAGADSYELLVSTDASLGNPLIAKVGAYALGTTAWQCDLILNYNTTYYWKVRARSSDSYSAWSAVSAFTTKPLPPASTASTQPPPASPPSPPPAPPPAQPTTPDWVFYMMGFMGFIVIVLLATILVLVIRQR